MRKRVLWFLNIAALVPDATLECKEKNGHLFESDILALAAFKVIHGFWAMPKQRDWKLKHLSPQSKELANMLLGMYGRSFCRGDHDETEMDKTVSFFALVNSVSIGIVFSGSRSKYKKMIADGRITDKKLRLLCRVLPKALTWEGVLDKHQKERFADVVRLVDTQELEAFQSETPLEGIYLEAQSNLLQRRLRTNMVPNSDVWFVSPDQKEPVIKREETLPDSVPSSDRWNCYSGTSVTPPGFHTII